MDALGATPEPAETSGDPPVPSAYTIDELASVTGVPSRTIRFYQAKGALPPPERRGRVAYYDASHAERLRLVAHMQDRGLSLRAIRDLFQRAEGGEVSVSDWLGVGEQLRAPWSDDRPRVITEEEIVALVGAPLRPGLIADLMRLGVVRREPNTMPTGYFVSSPGMLQIALRLEAAGVGIESAHVAQEIIRKQMSRASDELVDYFVNHVQEGSGPEEIARSVNALRSVGMDAVRLIFAQEIERAVREAIEQGRALPPRNKKRR
jgi:DNA-binding transcriptional MerR regulator